MEALLPVRLGHSLTSLALDTGFSSCSSRTKREFERENVNVSRMESGGETTGGLETQRKA